MRLLFLFAVRRLLLLDVNQQKKAVFDKEAPSEIITGASRKAMIEQAQGILYSELNSSQQKNIYTVTEYLYSSVYPLVCHKYDERNRNQRIE